MIYVKIEEPIRKKKNENGIKQIISSFLQLIIPKANPNFENKLDLVAYWLLEFQDKDSTPAKEIGLNNNEDVILKMPYKNNAGYWVDNNLTIEDFQKSFRVVEITQKYFNEKWESEFI